MNLDDLTETFELLGDWESRYQFLIDLGKKLPALTDAERCEANKVRGCMSQVWMVGGMDAAGHLAVRGDSDAYLVKGLIALLLLLLNGQTPEQVLATDVPMIFKDLGLENHITVNRRNGFYAMLERVRHLAEQM